MKSASCVKVVNSIAQKSHYSYVASNIINCSCMHKKATKSHPGYIQWSATTLR